MCQNFVKWDDSQSYSRAAEGIRTIVNYSYELLKLNGVARKGTVPRGRSLLPRATVSNWKACAASPSIVY